MIDPGAIGTLTIGLRRIQDDEAAAARAARQRRARRPIRHGIAAILRRTAEIFEPVPATTG